MRTRLLPAWSLQSIDTLQKHLIITAAVVAMTAASATVALAQNAPGKSQKATLDDPTIVAIFDAANTWDIETGKLAVKSGSSKDVRDFGAMLVHDHTMVRQQGRDLAKKLKVHPTPPKNFSMVADHKAAMKKLRGLEGEAFDRAFLAHEVAFHKAVIDAVNTTLMPAIQNAELKKLVTDVAPAFQAHMLKAQSMLDAMKK